jgi:hypothetical protein
LSARRDFDQCDAARDESDPRDEQREHIEAGDRQNG